MYELVTAFKAYPGIAKRLAEYGDKRAIEVMSQALDAMPVGKSAREKERLVDVAQALRTMGATLSPDQELKVTPPQQDPVVQQKEPTPKIPKTVVRHAVPIRKKERQERNDPCWCGSGAK